MNAVGAALERHVHVVVDNEGHAVAAAEGLDLHRLRGEIRRIHVLFPQLDNGGAPLQGLLDLLI